MLQKHIYIYIYTYIVNYYTNHACIQPGQISYIINTKISSLH